MDVLNQEINKFQTVVSEETYRRRKYKVCYFTSIENFAASSKSISKLNFCSSKFLMFSILNSIRPDRQSFALHYYPGCVHLRKIGRRM